MEEPSRKTSMAAVAGEERYRIEGEIGRGGMGRVLSVYDHKLKRKVAMKVLKPDASSEGRLRFIDEVRIMSGLEHPNIMPIHDLGTYGGGEVFFTMRLFDGGERMSAVIARLRSGDAAAHAAWPLHKRAQVILQVLSGLRYAHEGGVIHRDLKPQNIMIGPYGEVTILDWGFARPPEDLRSYDEPVTLDGPLMGTPLYMSPEQAEGLNTQVDARADIFCAAAVAYEFFTLSHHLEPIPEGADLADLLARITSGRHTPANCRDVGRAEAVPASLARVLERALSKKPEDRHPTATALYDEIQACLGGTAPAACAETAIARLAHGYLRFLAKHDLLGIFGLLLVFAFAVIGVAATLLVLVGG